MSKGSIFVNCWSCERKFDITSAERCYEHLNGDWFDASGVEKLWTTKCSHCGSCICHKFHEMKKLCNDSITNNDKLRLSGIESVMPSIHKKLCPITSLNKGNVK